MGSRLDYLKDRLPSDPREATDRSLPLPRADSDAGEQRWPRHVVQMLAEPSIVGTRSERHWALLCALWEVGCDDDGILSAMREHAPSVDKYGPRLADVISHELAKMPAPRGSRRSRGGSRESGPSSERSTEGSSVRVDSRMPVSPDPARYIDPREGLKVVTIAEDIEELLPVGVGGDGGLWVHEGGVWRPGEERVRTYVAGLLGERLRESYWKNVRLRLVSSGLPQVTCDPVREVINFRNGNLEWKSGAIRDHSPDVMSTVQLPVDWRPGSSCPAIRRWVGEVLGDDCLPFFLELTGYLMMSGNPLHKAVLLLGDGRNGKGTMLRLWEALLGSENVSTVPLQLLSENRFRAAELYGRIANFSGDISDRSIDDTSILKMVTGDDRISAEKKYGQPFSFRPWAVPVFSGNRVPGSKDSSGGFAERWIVVPFATSFSEVKRADGSMIEARLQSPTELEGLAFESAKALQRLMARGLFEYPDAVSTATARFRERMDPIQNFVSSNCAVVPGAWVSRSELAERLEQWCGEESHGAGQANRLYEYLRAVDGLEERARHGGIRGFDGLRLIHGEETGERDGLGPSS